MQTAKIYIGTSGWHYTHWLELFYPPSIKGYYELQFYSDHFNTVENNSSFYRISKESTYKTWDRMTPQGFVFSLKLNKAITHVARLALTPEVKEKVAYILDSTQVLKEKLGTVVIQLPPSFKAEAASLESFLKYFTLEVKKRNYKLDVAIEFRNKYWFTEKTYKLLEKYNVALVAAQSSRYPGVKHVTANTCYIRLHGPEKLFASLYTTQQLAEWADYIKKTAKKVERIYVYFNNDFHGYAIQNAKQLQDMLGR